MKSLKRENSRSVTTAIAAAIALAACFFAVCGRTAPEPGPVPRGDWVAWFGTFVLTTYGHWAEGETPYIVSVRFKLNDIDRIKR